MTPHEILARRRAQFENPAALDAIALRSTLVRPTVMGNFLQSLLGEISGADYQANNTANYYQNALGQLGPGGTAAAKAYAAKEQAALQPQFTQQDNQLAARESAMGIGHSGAAKADFSQLTADQGATLAGAEAPLYSQGLSIYGNILGQEPGAENSSYQNALSQFYQMVQQGAAAAAGAPGVGGAAVPAGTGGPALTPDQQAQSQYQTLPQVPGTQGYQPSPYTGGSFNFGPSYTDNPADTYQQPAA